MAQENSESFVDRVKSALGMGDRPEEVETPEQDGWAGVPPATSMEEEIDLDGRTTAAERVDVGDGGPELDIGLDRESNAGTGEHDTGTGPDFEFGRREPAPEDGLADEEGEIEARRRELGI